MAEKGLNKALFPTPRVTSSSLRALKIDWGVKFQRRLPDVNFQEVVSGETVLQMLVQEILTECKIAKDTQHVLFYHLLLV